MRRKLISSGRGFFHLQDLDIEISQSCSASVFILIGKSKKI